MNSHFRTAKATTIVQCRRTGRQKAIPTATPHTATSWRQSYHYRWSLSARVIPSATTGERAHCACLHARYWKFGGVGSHRHTPSPAPPRSPGQRQLQDQVCWHHTKLGDNARKCKPPCIKLSGNSQASR